MGLKWKLLYRRKIHNHLQVGLLKIDLKMENLHLGRAELNSEFGFVRKQHKWKNIDG